MAKVQNFSDFNQSVPRIYEAGEGFKIKDRVFGGNVLKTGRSFQPIDISGDKVFTASQRGAIGLQGWNFINYIKAIREKGSKSTSTDYKKIILKGGKTTDDDQKIVLQKGDGGFATAATYIQSIRRELEESPDSTDDQKAEIDEQAQILYRLFLDKALQSIITLRSILPDDMNNPEGDDVLASADIFGKASAILTSASGKNTKEGHTEMWKSINDLAQEGENLIKRVILILGKKIPKPEEGETRSQVVQRGIADSRNQRDVYINTGNGAAEWLKEAVKKYSIGALQVLNEYTDSAIAGMEEILGQASDQFNTLKKGGDSAVKESFSSEIKALAINRVLPLFEEKKRRNIVDEDPFGAEDRGQVAELSRDALLDQVVGVATVIDNYLAFFRNTPFSEKIEAEAKKYQDVVRGLAIKLSKTEFLSDKDLKSISDKLAELNAPSGDLSVNEWKERSLKKYDKQITANEFMKAGDSAMAKANELIDMARRISYYDEKRSQQDIDKIIPRLTKDDLPTEDTRIDAIRGGGNTGGNVSGDDGKLTKDGLEKLKINISNLLGVDKKEYDSSESKLNYDIGDVAFRLSLITGKNYKKGDGWDLDSLNDDIFVFNKVRPEILGSEK